MSSSETKSLKCQKLDPSTDLLKYYHNKLDPVRYEKVLADLWRQHEVRFKSPLCEHCRRLALDLFFLTAQEISILQKDELGTRQQDLLRGRFNIDERFVIQCRDHEKNYQSCSLCNLLLRTLGRHNKPLTNQEDEVKEGRFGIVYWNGRDDDDQRRNGQLWKLRTISSLYSGQRFIAALSAHSEFGVGRILEAQADLSLLQSWLVRCTLDRRSEETLSVEAWMPVFTMSLIDCSRLSVVPYRPGEKYVAFSYVWGDSQPSVFAHGQLQLNQLPKAIQDAISLTLSVGLRYLWIDRYCISEDEQTKGHQIRNMDQVYNRAEFTIVSLKSDPTFGLPGVNGTLRRPQPRAQIGVSTFTSTLSVPFREIDKSAWVTRGWTFQEAFLSKNLLFFTDEQMYFQSHDWDACEAIDFSDNVPIVERKRWISLWDARDAYCKNASIVQAGSLDGIWGLINQYSYRSLRFSGDYLNAFLGILRHFEPEPYGMRHYWGVPLLLTKDEDGNRATNEFLYRLSHMHMPANAGRCEGFPTWTWLGWIGGRSRTRYAIPFLGNTSPVHVLMADGRWRSLENYINSSEYFLGTSLLSPYIRVLAWITRLRYALPTVLESISDAKTKENSKPTVHTVVELVQKHIRLDTKDDRFLRLSGVTLAEGATFSQMEHAFGVVFQTPSNSTGHRTIQLIYGGDVGTSTRQGSWTEDIVFELVGSAKIHNAPPPKRPEDALIFHSEDFSKLIWEKQYIYLQ